MNLFSTIQVLLELLDLRQNWSGSKVQTCNLFVLVSEPTCLQERIVCGVRYRLAGCIPPVGDRDHVVRQHNFRHGNCLLCIQD